MGYSLWDRKESDTTEQPSAQVGVHDVNLQVQLVWGLQACGQHAILNLLPPGGGFSICRVTQRYCCVYPLMWEMGPCPKAALDCFSLVSHALPSLINSCLDLPTGMQQRSWRAFLVAQTVKESACDAGDVGLIPGLGRSPGGGHGSPL